MTYFQRNAADKIRHIGGSIFYATDSRWIDKHGQRVTVPSFDFKTEGFIGWPTIQALIAKGALRHKGGNEYTLGASIEARAA